eukprot:TRINITY_DN7742_c0_g1_i1.p1 TRINITY_DN7742_c0_g1~~TRINITY_DN7742_c0_g1_i1.p1  ORF type:complete len:633 (+),score=117.87 TRINITY_DN7742_c0_g1_i1:97-1995(+)
MSNNSEPNIPGDTLMRQRSTVGKPPIPNRLLKEDVPPPTPPRMDSQPPPTPPRNILPPSEPNAHASAPPDFPVKTQTAPLIMVPNIPQRPSTVNGRIRRSISSVEECPSKGFNLSSFAGSLSTRSLNIKPSFIDDLNKHRKNKKHKSQIEDQPSPVNTLKRKKTNNRRRGMMFKNERTFSFGELNSDKVVDEDGITESAKRDWYISLWDITPDMIELVYSKTEPDKLLGGTLNGLVTCLTDPSNSDSSFANAFLMTYKSFVTPSILLDKIIERYEGRGGINDQKIRIKTLSILVKWIESHIFDFTMDMIEKVNLLVEKIRDSGSVTMAEKIEGTVSTHFTGLEKLITRQFNDPPPSPKIPRGELSFKSISPLEIARQLSLQDWEVFEKIETHEFLNLSWSNEKLKHTASHILELIKRFNSLSILTAVVILSETKLRKRIKLFGTFLNIAWNLHNLGNFCSAVAIGSGLSRASCYRLHHTIDGLSSSKLQKWDQLKFIMNTDGSHKNYREVLNSHLPPCIPHIGIFLTDLTFIEDGNDDMIEDYYINFKKRTMIHDVIREVCDFQQVGFNLLKVENISEWLKSQFESIKCLVEDQDENVDRLLYMRSRQIEPKDWDGSSVLNIDSSNWEWGNI